MQYKECRSKLTSTSLTLSLSLFLSRPPSLYRLHHDQQTAHALESAAAYSSYPTMAGAYSTTSLKDIHTYVAWGQLAHCPHLSSLYILCAIVMATRWLSTLIKCLIFSFSLLTPVKVWKLRCRNHPRICTGSKRNWTHPVLSHRLGEFSMLMLYSKAWREEMTQSNKRKLFAKIKWKRKQYEKLRSRLWDDFNNAKICL